MPTDLNQATGTGTTELPGLRVSSSIPRSGLESSGDTWLYPSPRMFYNALSRKGYQPRLEDMDVIVTIHNMVNEQTWQAILWWEDHYHPGGEPKLGRFLGRPDDMSPRAWFRTLFLGYKKPFDRHDWFVERADGSKARYVIDFYSGKSSANLGEELPLPSFHIDARPALDSWQALYERVHLSMSKLMNRLSETFSNPSTRTGPDQSASLRDE